MFRKIRGLSPIFHSSRLCQFGDVDETENVLRGLMERSDGPFVAQLTREPGRREVRYAHLFGDHDIDAVASVPIEATAIAESGDAKSSDRITQLEDLVLELQEELEAVKARVEVLEQGSESD